MGRCSCRLLLFASAAAACLLAFSLYEPLPDYAQDRTLLAVRCAVLKAYTTLGRLMERLNLGSFETSAHRTSGLAFSTPRNTNTVTFYYRQFAGIRTLVVTPASTGVGSSAAVIYIHGGGWAFGAPEMYNAMFEEIVDKAGVTVFALSYRLSPEQSFPAAFDDCLSATLSIFNSAQSLGLDASRIAIAGDSAGGQLTASVVQQLRRSGSVHRPKLHLMVYPVTQVVNLQTSSYKSQSNAALMKHLRLQRFLSLYLIGSLQAADWISRHGHVTVAVRSAYERATGESFPDSPEAAAASASIDESVANRVTTLATDFRVSPLLAADLDQLKLPPLHIVACEFDRLFDDAVMYANRLQRAGVRTQLRRIRTYHGAMDMPNDGREIRNYLVEVFRDSL